MSVKNIFFFGLVILALIPTGSFAAGTITLSPAKQEVKLKPGTEVVRKIIIANNLGREATFSIGVEDFAGTQDPNNPVNLLGDKLGSYSLKNYIFPAVSSLTLKAGEQYVLPVTIRLSPKAPPGGLYGAVLVSANNLSEPLGNTRIATRLGSLFFVRVDGPVTEGGSLRKFNSVRGQFAWGGKPILAQIVYENTGNIYLNPYAQIEIRNWLHRPVKTIKLDPWYVLPGAIRSQTAEWNYSWLSFGRYEVTLNLNKGYQNQVVSQKFSVWVFPWQLLLIILLVIATFTRFKKRHV